MQLNNKPPSVGRMVLGFCRTNRLAAPKHSQAGFTLIEIAIVLTIVGLIIGGIWMAAATVFNNNKAQRFTKDLIQVVQNTKTIFAGQGAAATGTNFTILNAYTGGVFPLDMVSSASTPAAPVIITPFSTTPATSDVTIAGVTATTVGYKIVDITQQACTQAVVALGSQNNMTNLGITAIAAGPAAANAVALPATGATAAAACAGAAGTAPTGYAIQVTMNVF